MQEKRIEKLRTHALNCKPSNAEWVYLFAKGFLESAKKEKAYCCRFAAATAYMLENAQPVIDEDELIVGKMSCRALTQTEQAEWENLKKYSLPSKPRLGGQASHLAVDYDKLLALGADGIIRDAAERAEKLDLTIPENLEKYNFYQSCIIALGGLCRLADQYAALASELAEKCVDEKRKNELKKIAENCRNVPKKPARTFYEAVQSASFLTFCLSGPDTLLYQLGRPDRYLLKFYINDIENRVISREFAQELIDCMGLLYNEYIPGGLAVGYMVGGRDENGRDVTNDLTYMFIESIGHIRMIYPGVGLCCNNGTPDNLLELSCDMLGKGYSHPALFNDDVIIKGLQYYGLPYSEACNYIHSTCVEITPVASSATWVASPYVNLVQLLLDTIGIKKENSVCVEFETFEKLQEAFFNNLSAVIKKNIIEQNLLQLERTKFSFNPLLSCFVNDCMQKGMDIESGGARYNWIMPSFVGVGNVADSFGVINEMVYKNKAVTIPELAVILENNFNGYEEKKQLFQNRVDKYGNDIDTADFYVSEITGMIAQECKKYSTYRKGKLVPSLFCWVMHNEFGKNTMASPDGRTEGFPLGDGSGPAQGREKHGPTASILSSTKWDHYPFIGGIAVNMKFSKKMFNDESKKKLMSLIKTFMMRGGFEIQINAVDKDVLLKAVKTPELYGDLVVRVGGYSDYFVRLSPSMQAEVIERTGHIL